MTQEKRIYIQKDGPYRVEGDVPLRKEFVAGDENNDPVGWKVGEAYKTKGKQYLLCRCGKSKNKPFCDRTHEQVKFDGTETASHDSYRSGAETIEGAQLDLLDNAPLCSAGRFCHRMGTTWKLTKFTDRKEARKLVIQQACDCPSGRLLAILKETGEEIERDCEASIGVTEDMPAQVSGPLWAKGGIEVVGADGKPYEQRNRQALCRCGASRNKPFCDGSHIRVGFDDKK